jgi:phage shock protein C
MEENARFCAQCGNLVATATAAPTGSIPVQTSPYVVIEAPRLTRALRNRRIAGVCAGLAHYFGVDPTLVRILFVALFFFPILPAIIPYVVCWVVMPLEDPRPLPAVAYNTHPSQVAPLPR